MYAVTLLSSTNPLGDEVFEGITQIAISPQGVTLVRNTGNMLNIAVSDKGKYLFGDFYYNAMKVEIAGTAGAAS